MNTRKFTDADLLKIAPRLAADQPLDGLELSKPRRVNNEESRNQIALIDWWKFNCKNFNLPEIALKASPLQGIRDGKTGARMKREGMRRGDLDLNLTCARNGFHGLFLELKTEDGRLTDDQNKMISHLSSQGYMCKVARSFYEAKSTIEQYLHCN